MTHSIEPARQIRAQSHDFGYDHEVQIALPASYDATNQDYPVLWVTDGSLYFHMAASIAQQLVVAGKGPEFIVVSVGQPRRATFEEFTTRRLIDFFPSEDLSTSSIGDVEMWKLRKGGHASEFLSFLVDELRPSLEQEFRMRPGAHTISGVSGGGFFATYALFTRPSAFNAFLIACPPYELSQGEIFELEAEYAKNNSDLAAKVYFTAGAEELTEPVIADLGIVPSMLRMASTLNLRRYASLSLSYRIVDGDNHGSIAVNLFRDGIENLWRKDAAMPRTGRAQVDAKQ
jgi:uncharacterized protein